MHGDEQKYISQAIESNWVSTEGENLAQIEKMICEKTGCKYAIPLSSGTAALHLAVKHAGETLYGKPDISHGALEGKRVFCSDMTFDATLNPVVYEGGIPVFIDTEAESWNMDPIALEKAFEMYPDVKLVVSAELYGFPGRMDLIKEISKDKLVNRADFPDNGDIIVPTSFNIGDIEISIFTNGKSPLMARQLRKKIQSIITEEDILEIELQDYSRSLLKKYVPNQKDRRDYLYKIFEDKKIQNLIESGEINKAKAVICELVKRDFDDT